MDTRRCARTAPLVSLACAILFGCGSEESENGAPREAVRLREPVVLPQPAPAEERRPEEQSAREDEREPPDEAESSEEEQLRFEISISERTLYVYRGDERIQTHPVAVGEPDYPTPRGEFRIQRVDWNPDWTPPEGEWAEEFEYTPPGDPDNPMGRARLVFKPPYTIHGTDDLGSLGSAESHGSVRVANDVVVDLARLVMEHGGAARPESWYEAAMANPSEMRSVHLPEPVPVTIRD